MQQQQDMTGQNAGLWQIDIFTPHQPVALEAGLEARFEVTSLSVSRTEGGLLHLQGWCELQPDAKDESQINFIGNKKYTFCRKFQPTLFSFFCQK